MRKDIVVNIVSVHRLEPILTLTNQWKPDQDLFR